MPGFQPLKFFILYTDFLLISLYYKCKLELEPELFRESERERSGYESKSRASKNAVLSHRFFARFLDLQN